MVLALLFIGYWVFVVFIVEGTNGFVVGLEIILGTSPGLFLLRAKVIKPCLSVLGRIDQPLVIVYGPIPNQSI